MTHDETPINGEAINAEPEAPTAARSRVPKGLRGRKPSLTSLKGRAPSVHAPSLKGKHAPEPVEAAAFAVQDRVIWPLQDRFALLGPGGERRLFAGGAVAVVAGVGVAAALLLSSGGGATDTTTVEAVATAPRAPLIAKPAHSAPVQKAPTLHGAAPVFKPAPATHGKAKVGGSEAVEAPPAEEAATSSSASANPATDKISSQPGKVVAQDGAAELSRVTGFDGPPAGPAAVKVAKEFAAGFVVYETGGPKSSYKDAFDATAVPELTRSLLERPPRQPAGVKVPQAKVVNVVAGPSNGSVYKVSVSLLRVGVTSELRLDLEQIEPPKSGKGAARASGSDSQRPEWRVTNVLG